MIKDGDAPFSRAKSIFCSQTALVRTGSANREEREVV
jgi:hypothetical protein